MQRFLTTQSIFPNKYFPHSPLPLSGNLMQLAVNINSQFIQNSFMRNRADIIQISQTLCSQFIWKIQL
jgi:hypothetical protein